MTTANVPFPSTPVIDTFDRANGALGASWADDLLTDNGPLAVLSNQLAKNNPDDNFSTAYWTSLFGTNQEAYVTLGTTTVRFELHVRASNPGAASTSYCLFYDPGTFELQFQRQSAGTYTDIGPPIGITLSIHQGVGIRIDGRTLTAFLSLDADGFYGDPEPWIEIGSAIDSTYVSGRYIGVAMIQIGPDGSPGVGTLDNFGGGTFVQPSGADTSFPRVMEERIYAALPFPEAQAQLASPGLMPTRPVAASCGWHGTGLDPERGSFAIVARDGPLADLVGERLAVSRRDTAEARTVYVYVHADSDTLTEELSLTRRAFMALADPALEDVPVVVEVVA